MKRLLLTLSITFVLLNVVKADLGAPTIQAICKVTLNDNKIVEGVISFGKGGYDYNYRPSGFCFIHSENVYQLNLFSFSFVKFTPNNYGAYRDGKSKLFYAENQNIQSYPNSTFEFKESERMLTKSTEMKEGYKLQDNMVLYMTIPLHLYVGIDSEKQMINVENIKSVELLRTPSKEWISKIDSARKKLIEEQKKDEWMDYMEPVWYHEIINDEKQVTYLKQFFNLH